MRTIETETPVEYREHLLTRIERADDNENSLERTMELEKLWDELDAVEADLAQDSLIEGRD